MGAGSEAGIRFRDAAREADLVFTLDHSPTAQKHMIETMPGGLAIFDFDSDGLPDVFFTNGAAIPSLKKGLSHQNRLFRNLGGLKFSDVTGSAGLNGEGYSMGAAAADFDNDGHVDLFVAGVRHNLLYRNRGDGTFEEIAGKAGIHSDEWAVAAGWFDYDRDGLLDLFVVNYSKWSAGDDRFCGDKDRGLRVYCHPKYFPPIPNTLYRNRGDGTFEETTARSGIGQHAGRGMSVAFADYDSDGWPDAFVTNDNLPNFLFRNNGDGTFEEVALLAGVALLDHGKPVASMGADFRDYNNDGLPDISVTALSGETYPLFRNTGAGLFQDATHASAIAQLSSRVAGWSTVFGDFDNDGWKDLFTANAHVNDIVEKFEAAEYRQSNSIFRNLGDGRFADVSEPAGLTQPRAHRGSAIADLNGDGKLDVVVSSLGDPAELWVNETPNAGHWLLVRLKGVRSNRDGIGARVQIGRQHNLMTSAIGYASSSHSGIHFGLGSASQPVAVIVEWPSGTRQIVENVQVDQVIQIDEPVE